jgi:hypothetical protein
VYVNRPAAKATSVPRHREVDEYLARKICRDLLIRNLDRVAHERRKHGK